MNNLTEHRITSVAAGLIVVVIAGMIETAWLLFVIPVAAGYVWMQWNKTEDEIKAKKRAKADKIAKTHHGFHIIMVFLTGGIWLIPWFLMHQRTKTKRHEQLLNRIGDRGL